MRERGVKEDNGRDVTSMMKQFGLNWHVIYNVPININLGDQEGYHIVQQRYDSVDSNLRFFLN